MQWWRKIRQEKHLQSDASYLAQVRSLGKIYDCYGAAQRNLKNACSLDLGPGSNLRNPFACQSVRGIDMVENLSLGIVAADLVVEPIPFTDKTFDYVTAYDFIEHIPRIIYQPARRLPFIELMNEIWTSLGSEADSVPVPEWHVVEIKRRLAAFAADGTPGRPADEVLAELTRRL